MCAVNPCGPHLYKQIPCELENNENHKYTNYYLYQREIENKPDMHFGREHSCFVFCETGRLHKGRTPH